MGRAQHPFVLFVCIVNVMAAVSIAVCWLVFAAVWLITANYNETRAPAQRQRSWYGTGAIPVLIISFVIRLAVPRADWQAVTFSAPWARFLGLAILLAATALTLWARFTLGLMWSAAPAVKEGHQLRTSGPYAITRHPIYTGLLGMLLGTMLVAGAGPVPVPLRSPAAERTKSDTALAYCSGSSAWTKWPAAGTSSTRLCGADRKAARCSGLVSGS